MNCFHRLTTTKETAAYNAFSLSEQFKDGQVSRGVLPFDSFNTHFNSILTALLNSKSWKNKHFLFQTPLRLASLVVQTVKNQPVMQETGVRSLSQEDSLEKRMDTHSSILAWKSPCTEEPGSLYSPWSHKESQSRTRLSD